jgi:subtilase family serine protease
LRKLLIAASCAATALVLAVAGTAANGNANYHAVCPAATNGSAHCHALVVTDSKGNPSAGSTPTGYGPSQFHGAYSLPATAAAVQTVAIVDAYDDPTAEQDLATYSAQYGLPSCTTANGCFSKVSQTGSTSYPRANQGWALEISLDVQTVHAICENCHILLVEAKSNSFANLMAAEDYATAHASIVSNSYGGSESSADTSYDSHFAKAGKAITVSTGDNGYGVEYPASSPYVTAVGGTTLNLSGTSRVSETVWSGSGSGCSAYEPKQSWQTDAGCSRRTVADVAADADPNTGAAVYDSYGDQGRKGWFQVGGTSLASPLVAGVYALAGNAASVSYGSYPYAHASSLNDITSGSNGSCGSYLCTGTTGFDGPTGLGSPNGTGGF